MSETLLSRVPWVSSSTADEVLLVMVKEDPRATEEAVYILKSAPSPRQPQYKLVHARAKEALAFKDGPVDAEFSETAIDAEMVTALERSWGRMTLEARWPNRSDTIKSMKFRGVTYTFDYVGDNVYGQGETVSPEPGSCAASITSLGELLIRFVDSSNDEQRRLIRLELLRTSNTLAARLGGALPTSQSNGIKDDAW